MLATVPWSEESASPEPASATLLARASLAAFAVGIPIDVILASRIGSSSAILGIPLAAGAAWQVLRIGAFRRAPAALLLLTGFVALAATSVLWARDLEGFTTRITTFVQLLVFVWLSWQILRTRRDLRVVLYGYLCGCGLLVADSWRTFRTGGVAVAYGRYAAEAYDPNDMAVTLAIGIPIAAYLAFGAGSRRLAYVTVTYVPVALGTIVLSGSRSGTLTAGLSLAAVVLWIAGGSRTALAWTAALLLAGTAGATSVIPEESWSRIFTVRQQLAHGTLGDRTRIWQAGLEVLGEHPVIGVGLGGFPRSVERIITEPMSAHNTPLSIAVDTGIIGLALFSCVLVALLLGALAAARHERALAFTLLLTWMVGTAALTWEHRKTTWFVFLVVAAAGAFRPAASRPWTDG